MNITGQDALHTRTYTNLFLELGYDENEITTRLEDTWKELFYGDENTRIYYPMDEDKGYLLDTGNFDVRSEGMSYGMMMAVQMDKKKNLTDSGISPTRLCSIPRVDTKITSLGIASLTEHACRKDRRRTVKSSLPWRFFASNRWGDGAEPYDYKAQARKILSACIHQGEDGEGDPMWDPETKLIKFIPETPFSDPSYHLPHFYELFAIYADDADQAFGMKRRQQVGLICIQLAIP